MSVDSHTAKLNRVIGNLKRALHEERKATASIRESLGVKSTSEALGRVQELIQGVEEWAPLMDELEDYRSGSLEPDEKDELIEQLYGERTEREHFEAFREVANEAGVNPAALKHLWGSLGYSPDGDPDPDTFRELLTGARESSPFYFLEGSNGAENQGQTSQSAGVNRLNPSTPGLSGASPAKPPESSASSRQPLQGIGGGRGVTNGSPGRMRVSKSQTRDPAWMQANGKAYAEAYKAKTLDFVDNE